MNQSDGEWEPAIMDKMFPCSTRKDGKGVLKGEHSTSAYNLYWWDGNDGHEAGWYCSSCYQVSEEYKEISRDAPIRRIGMTSDEETIAYWKKIDEFFASKRRFIDEIAELDENGLDNLTQEVQIWISPLSKYLDD